ncbi:MAG: DegV family protein [Anaerolineales bacterium]
MSIHIVTDSTCDIPPELAERYRIHVVPSILNVEGRSYRDGAEISRLEFYARLPGLKSQPTTAAPASGEFESLYRQLGEGEIISIHLAAQLSAMFNAARLGADASGARVTLVDSGQVSMGLGWQVLAAAEAAAAGRPLAEVLATVESVRRRVRVFAVLDTLEYLRRSGRASAVTAVFGQLLQIKPIVEVAEGKVLPVARLRTHAKALEKLIEMVEALGPLERLAVFHTTSPDEVRVLAGRLAPRSAQPPLVGEITAVIGTHSGPGTLGVAGVRAL